jgi:hypothetical protein
MPSTISRYRRRIIRHFLTEAQIRFITNQARSTRNPSTNTIINTTAGYLDLSQLYGSDAATAASLREADGTLKTSPDGTDLPIVNGVFVTGDPRVMENPELTATTILFMREHNFWVGILKNSIRTGAAISSTIWPRPSTPPNIKISSINSSCRS